ncbi:tRNA preQ1(34) S-adenosylmethionine ribosyltransferase-isomerase QueA [Bacteriovorax sp. Seq25_V]|uniref:tRNA preQ1(34) S-adenosylmethionine ribosyltransferase-isomerase QueA n=1 Tax=Bacteriovorax sp. Seq25_V TaxID=1201288 RepID=UPI00038A378D|nr:tRNA preQ1(34) S-adenosylmethionine ribosyltransferase-isomerase QueA [Bacteriovorax sp. Seq25_V]EQC44182.1 S-adenosylmethionine:tRNA ribosyltransferase-isomerase [Bacteriovorax sp. Seq25_V]
MHKDQKDYQLDSYDYDLPEHLIASRPVEGRHHSKLLVYNVSKNEVSHHQFHEIVDLLPEDSTLVLNQSKVFPCRLMGNKVTGGQVEVFFLTIRPSDKGCLHCLIKARGKKKLGDRFLFDDGLEITIAEIINGTFHVTVNVDDIENYLNTHATIPIPPYIRDGVADERDKEDYQTVYAKEVGSVAAPTAGLHFTDEIFDKLAKRGIERSFVTLHVGMGTFAPVKTNDIREHEMHSESYHIDSANFEKIKSANKRFAVGTTSLRVLESVWQRDDFETNKTYETNIFLHPGKNVQSIDGMITNFHLPKSTLLMLISSLMGREKALELYRIAVEKEYRFFSYGDAMLIIR